MFLFGGPRTVDIAPAALQGRLERGEKPRLIDVREDSEFAEGHIPGSILRPLGQIQTWADQFKKNEEIILICRSGNRSSVAYQYLKKQGFTDLKNMSGGIIAWRGAVVR